MQLSHKKPTEFVLSKVGSIRNDKFTAGSIEGELTSVGNAYNLVKEVRIDERKKNGTFFTANELTNIMLCIENTKEEDVKARQEAGSKSSLLLGIVQCLHFMPHLNIYFHSRGALLIMCELSRMGRLILSEDATGDMWDLRGTQREGKIQHTKMSMHASESVLSNKDGTDFAHNLYRPYRVAERVSDVNTASEYAQWTMKLRKDAKLVSAEWFGFEIDPIPVAVKFDCALELLHGAVSGYRMLNQVDTGKTYHNVVLLILLHHEYTTNELNDVALLMQHSKTTHDIIKKHCPCVFKQCSVHVCRAMRDIRSNMKSPPKEMNIYRDQFDTIHAHLAATLRNLPRIVEVITRLSVVIALYEMEELHCQQFDIDSPVRDHHDSAISNKLAVDMDIIIQEEIKNIMINDFQKLEEKLDKEMQCVGTREHKQRFKGHAVVRRVVDRMKKDLAFACPYLHTKDKVNQKGVVNICYVYSCYDDDENNKEIVSPQRLGGISVEVELPMKRNVIPNPMYSQRASKYWMTQWGDRVGLWCNAIIKVVEESLDARVWPNNQGIEGTFNAEKNHTSTAKTDTADLSSLISARWRDNYQGSRLLVKQLRRSEHVIEDKKKRVQKKSIVVKESSMKWQNKKRTASAQLSKLENKMKSALAKAAYANDIEVTTSTLSQWKVMIAHAKKIDTTFMCHDTFNTWVGPNKKQRKKKLNKDWAKVIEDFYQRYFPDSDEEV